MALLANVVTKSLKEGEVYWPKVKNSEVYSYSRFVFHCLIALAIFTTSIMLSIEEDRNTWEAGTVPTRWKWFFTSTAIVYGASAVPSVLALGNEALWEDTPESHRMKRMISINVVKEVITCGFLIPLIFGAADLVNDSNDADWRAYASSLVFTNAVVYFIVFWYVTEWPESRPLENDKVISRICRASGMFVIYVVLIRRLHQNEVITSMKFKSDRDNISLIGAFVLIFAGYAVKMKEQGLINVPTVGVVAGIFVILFILFITINI